MVKVCRLWCIFQLLYQHGFTALTFFMAALLGIILVALVAILYILVISWEMHKLVSFIGRGFNAGGTRLFLGVKLYRTCSKSLTNFNHIM